MSDEEIARLFAEVLRNDHTEERDQEIIDQILGELPDFLDWIGRLDTDEAAILRGVKECRKSQRIFVAGENLTITHPFAARKDEDIS